MKKKVKILLNILCVLFVGLVKAETISFEDTEGFVPANINKQKGWTDRSRRGFCFVVSDAKAKDGSNLLRINEKGIESVEYILDSSKIANTFSVWFFGNIKRKSFTVAHIYIFFGNKNNYEEFVKVAILSDKNGIVRFKYAYKNGKTYSTISSFKKMPALANYNKNGWNNLKYKFDFKNNKLSVYINNYKVVDNLAFKNGNDRIRKIWLSNPNTTMQKREVKYDLIEFSSGKDNRKTSNMSKPVIFNDKKTAVVNYKLIKPIKTSNMGKLVQICNDKKTVVVNHTLIKPIKITNMGKPVAVIVTSDKPVPITSFAATELQAHIKRASGAELNIITESKAIRLSGSKIYLGATLAACQNGISTKGMIPNEAIVKTVGNNLFLLGIDSNNKKILSPDVSAGTLFAVYEFLDSQLGVRWLWPGELGMFVSKKKTIRIGKILNIVIKPRFLYVAYRSTLAPHSLISKEASQKARHEQNLWLRRHRMSRDPRYRWDRGHNFTNYWKKYKNSHPEWFGQRKDGKRVPNKGGSKLIPMCVSQPGLVKQTVQDWLDKKILSVTVNACENDTGDFCHCKACMAMDGPDPKSKSDRYAKFWLAVQKEAEKYYSNAKVIGYAYWNHIKPPVETKLNPNTVVCLVTYKIFNKDGLKDSLNKLDGWGKTGASLFLRPNHTLFGHCMPWSYAHNFAAEFKCAVKNNVFGFDYNSLTAMWAMHGPRLYLMGRLLTKSDHDVEELLNEYYNGFGKAAPLIKKYFTYWENITAREYNRRVKYDGSCWNYYHRILDRACSSKNLKHAQKILNKAKNIKGLSPLALKRVEFLQKGLTNAVLTYKTAVAFAKGKQLDEPFYYIPYMKKLIAYRKSIEKDNVINASLCYKWEAKTWDYSLVNVNDKQRIVVKLPTRWSFKWDTKEIGIKGKWFSDNFNYKRWGQISTVGTWEEQQVGKKWKTAHNGKDYDGVAWYRTTFRLAPIESKTKLKIRFCAVDEGAEVWVNGIKIGSHPFIKPNDWFTPFEFNLPQKILRFGNKAKANTLSVQVTDRAGLGGIYRPVFIVTNK